MSIRSRIAKAGGIAAAVAAIGAGTAGVASAATAAPAVSPNTGAVHGCVLETDNGHYLTAVDGGGLVTNAIHSDATRPSSWELFFLSCGH
jgi:hypothetical protein